MNTVLLNTVHLDGAPIIKKGSGGGDGVTINNQSKNVDIVENGTTEIVADSGYTGLGKVSVNVAIPNEEKTVEITENGTTEVVAANGFLSRVVVNTNVASSGGGSGWTGHADVEGLKAIGWTDEDIAYYQEHGVNWNEEDDEYHKVTDDNKALYGVLTADNISTYKERIVYLPKIDTSNVESMSSMFSSCGSLVSIPMLDTSNVTNMYSMFSSCYSLVSIPQLDTRNVFHMDSMFSYCYSLVSIPQLNTSNVTNMSNMFYYCYSLVSIPQLDTSRVTNMYSMFYNCHSLAYIPPMNTSKTTSMEDMFYSCNSLTNINLKNVKRNCQLNRSPLLSKESLLYLINNEAATSAITIRLHSYAYERLATDVAVVEALTNHPNITLAK